MDLKKDLIDNLNLMYNIIKTSDRKDLMEYYHGVVLLLERMLVDEQITVTLAD